MNRRTVKGTALTLLATGCLFGGLGCLGDFVTRTIRILPSQLALEFLTDNDTTFDVFEDGAPAG